MPEVRRLKHLETEEKPYVIGYDCDCKKELKFYGYEKPERLEKCFNCCEVLDIAVYDNNGVIQNVYS